MPQRFSIVFVTRSYYSKANSTSDKHAYNRRSCSCDVKKKKNREKGSKDVGQAIIVSTKARRQLQMLSLLFFVLQKEE